MSYRLEPIVELATGEVIGHELLAGVHACPEWNEAAWRDWYAFLAEEIPRLLPELQGLLFLNLAGHQLLDPHISGSILALRDHAPRIVIEWTEQRFGADVFADVIKKIDFFKALGFEFAIDDIGAETGVDGLGRAGAVSPGFCKIDGHYFQKIREHGPECLRDLCRHLSHGGARVIVEWVETKEDYRWARAAGVLLGQGYLWTHAAETAQREVPV